MTAPQQDLGAQRPFFDAGRVGAVPQASADADTAGAFRLVRRPHGDCWLHASAPIWIVHYPATPDRAGFFQAYRSVARVPAGRQPWTVDNRRIGSERGFATFGEAAAAAAEVAGA